MKLAIIGAGYVGLVTAACFAEMGNEVICVDADADKIDGLKQGRIPIYEPGLDDYVKRNYQEKRLFFTTDLAGSVQKSLVIFIAVGTPQDKDGSADLSAVLAVSKEIGKALNGYKVIVEKSTVPVGTAAKVRTVMNGELKARGVDFEYDVVSNPEFLKEGTALDDFMKPDRIVVGCDEVRVAELMKELYAPFVRTHHPIIIMDVVSAELTKYRGQCLSGHQNFLYQRNCQYLLPHRRQHQHGAPGHRLGQQDRPPVSLSRAGLRRLLFPQGHAGPDSHRQVPGLHAAYFGRG